MCVPDVLNPIGLNRRRSTIDAHTWRGAFMLTPHLIHLSADTQSFFQLLTALHIWAARESYEGLGVFGMSAFPCSQQQGSEKRTVDLTLSVLQAGSLATFSSRTSLLACHTRVSTGMVSAFRPLTNGSHRPTLILHTKVPQQPRGDDGRVRHCLV